MYYNLQFNIFADFSIFILFHNLIATTLSFIPCSIAASSQNDSLKCISINHSLRPLNSHRDLVSPLSQMCLMYLSFIGSLWESLSYLLLSPLRHTNDTKQHRIIFHLIIFTQAPKMKIWLRP